jgi:SAM-dependent methyltransferase
VGTRWDARTYDRSATPQRSWAADVLVRLADIRADATVLDVGCGTGQVTEALLDVVPRGRVSAVDASEEMVRFARSRLGDRAEVRAQQPLFGRPAGDVGHPAGVRVEVRHRVQDPVHVAVCGEHAATRPDAAGAGSPARRARSPRGQAGRSRRGRGPRPLRVRPDRTPTGWWADRAEPATALRAIA